MYRKLASALLVASALSGQYAAAVSLGEITMHSALNEPLNADIKLGGAEDLDASQLIIRLATPDEYKDAGIERTFFHSDIKFSVSLNDQGNGVVHLRSERPLNEPFLDVLIESRWPTGRMLRSYTVLVDLPVYKEPQAAAVETKPVSKPAQTTKVRQPDAPAKTEQVASVIQERPKAEHKPIENGEEYFTVRNDSLWMLAKRVSAGKNISIPQAMFALRQSNPQAFIRGDINLLKEGVVLRVPTEDAMQQVSTAEARRALSSPEKLSQEIEINESDLSDGAAAQISSEREGSLRLTSSGAGSATGQEKTDVQAAEVGSESGAAEGKSDAAESIQNAQRAIELENERLAGLQQQLDQSEVVTDDTVTTAAQEKTAETVVEKTAVAVVDKPKTEAAKVEKTPAPSKPAVVKPTLLESIMQNPIYIGLIGLFAVLIMAVVLLLRRAKAEKQIYDDNESFDFDEYEEEESNAVDALAESAFEEEVPSEDASVAAEEAVLQTGDAISEADIYLSWSRYDQAAQILNTAIDDAPNNVALRSKLLEVYVAANDKDAFQKAYLELDARGETEAVIQAKELLMGAEETADWLDDLPQAEQSFAELDALVEEDENALDDAFDFESAADNEDLAGFATEIEDEEFSFEQDDNDLAGFAGELEESFDHDSTEEAPVSETVDDDVFAGLDVSFDDVQLGEVSDGDEVSSLSTADDDLSMDFDLSSFDETQLEQSATETLASSDDALSLDDFDLSTFEQESEGTAAEEKLEDTLSLDDFDFSAQTEDFGMLAQEDSSDTYSIAEASEDMDAELSLDDVDFVLDDVQSEEISAASLTESAEPELSLDDFDLNFDDVALPESTAAAEVPAAVEQTHTSAAMDALNEDDLAFVDSADEVLTKLDLAQAYLDMGDSEGAREILLEVLNEGNDAQRAEANQLINSLD